MKFFARSTGIPIDMIVLTITKQLVVKQLLEKIQLLKLLKFSKFEKKMNFFLRGGWGCGDVNLMMDEGYCCHLSY